MKRRTFIKNASLAALSPFVLQLMNSCTKVVAGKKPVFVFVQLIGGNDSLNTLIPLNNYKKIVEARPNLFIPEKHILPLTGTSVNGLHPSLTHIQEMYNNNLVSFVQGVGYDNPNYSHFRSSDIYLTGSSASEILSTGWMARYLETLYPDYPKGFPSAIKPDPPAIKIGDTGTFLFEGSTMDMSIVIDPASEFEAPDVSDVNSNDLTLAAKEVKAIRDMLLQTKHYAPTLKSALAVPFKHSSLYPEKGVNPLADQFKLVAKLINSGLNTSVYMVDLKGFDTHDNQVATDDSTKGPHSELLSQLSQGIACFWDDIEKMGRQQDVAGMVFSEFGRRIMSNASYGTDHGSSQAVMFFGANLKQGIIGNNPLIPEKLTVNDNLAVEYDFRSVYASVLKGWFKADEQSITKAVGPQPLLEVFTS